MEQEPVQESKLNPMKWKSEPNSKEGYNAESQSYKAKNGKTYMVYRVGLDPGKGSTTVFKVKGEKKHYKSLNDLLKRLDGMKESVELDEGAVKDAIMDFFESLPKASHKELLSAAKSKNRNAVAAALKKHKVKPAGKMVRNEKEMVDLILDWWPDMYDMFEETEVAGDGIGEANDSSISKVLKTAKKSVLADRGGRNSPKAQKALMAYRAAKDAHMKSVKEDTDIAEKVNLDARTSSFKEAMKRIEKYRMMREAKKKMITMQSEGKLLGMQNSIEQSVVMKDGKFTLPEAELSPDQKKYRAFFKSALSKFGKSSPDKMNDAEKKKFFQYVKSNWKGGAGVKEETETVDEAMFKPRQKVKLVANDSGLRTNLHHPKGKAVLDKSGKVVAIYKTEKAARQHAMTGKAVKEDID
jgi:hypothetical protein